MSLKDIYYYFIAFSMMAGVCIASALNLKIDQKPNGRIYIGFRSPDLKYNYDPDLKYNYKEEKL